MANCAAPLALHVCFVEFSAQCGNHSCFIPCAEGAREICVDRIHTYTRVSGIPFSFSVYISHIFLCRQRQKKAPEQRAREIYADCEVFYIFRAIPRPFYADIFKCFILMPSAYCTITGHHSNFIAITPRHPLLTTTSSLELAYLRPSHYHAPLSSPSLSIITDRHKK